MPTQARHKSQQTYLSHTVDTLIEAHAERCRGARPRMCTGNTRVHTHTPRHTLTFTLGCHFVHGKDKNTWSPCPHGTTPKHADPYTHTGGCCAAPTSTCGVFSFCLFWGRKTNRFSPPRPLEPISPTATSRCPEGSQSLLRVHRASVHLSAPRSLPTYRAPTTASESLLCAHTQVLILKHTCRAPGDRLFHVE